MSEFAKAGDTSVAAAAIVIAALTNTLVKCGIAIVLAGLTLGKPLLIATAAMLLCRSRRGAPAQSWPRNYARATAAATLSSATAAAGISQSE
jgi:hypothetical protein